jgi:hypothetical protein
MAQSGSFIASDEIHPIDVVEDVATHHAWDFDRLAEDQIAMVIEGQWRSYSVTLAWSPREEVLRLVCTFDLDPPADKLAMVFETINLVNDQVWEGSFTFWAPQQLMVWRYGLVLAGEAIALPEQVDRMMHNAVAACERFYPSFQLVGWGGTAPAAALDIALGETYGRA